MGPDPTRTYFWPAVKKRWPGFDPGTFWPDPKRFFLTRRKKLEKFDIFRGNFPNSNPNHKWMTRPGSKKFDPDPSLRMGICSIYKYIKDCLYLFVWVYTDHWSIAHLMYLCPFFTSEPPDQSPPNFVQTYTPIKGRFLTQITGEKLCFTKKFK